MDISEPSVLEAHEGLGKRERECFGVVVELAEVLQPWTEWVVVGGWAVYLLSEMFAQHTGDVALGHCGSIDVDIAVGWPGITEDVAEEMANALRAAGYVGPDGFHWYRPSAEGEQYTIDMMALPPEGHEGGPVRAGEYEFAPFWHGALAFISRRTAVVRGATPVGDTREAKVALPSPGGLLVIKAHSMIQPGRSTPARDAYDIYFLLASYPDGPQGFVEKELRVLGGSQELTDAVTFIQALFVESDEGTQMVLDVFRERGQSPAQIAAAVRTVMRSFVVCAKDWLRAQR